MRVQYKLLISGVGILISYLLPEVQIYLAFALILICGIPHGATDHILHSINKDKKIVQKPKAVFLIYYLSIIIVYAIFWYFLPSLSLLLFILISAFHFGETQLNNLDGKEWYKYLSYFFWGLSTLLLIFQPHLKEVGDIISPYLISEKSMIWLNSYFFHILLISLAGTFLTLISKSIRVTAIQFLELAMIFLVANFSSLLFSFAIFFAFWHSRDATHHQINKIKNFTSQFSFQKWAKLAFPYTLISLVGIILIILLSEYMMLEIPATTLFFVLVALITLPHVFVMSTFYRIPK